MMGNSPALGVTVWAKSAEGNNARMSQSRGTKGRLRGNDIWGMYVTMCRMFVDVLLQKIWGNKGLLVSMFTAQNKHVARGAKRQSCAVTQKSFL